MRHYSKINSDMSEIILYDYADYPIYIRKGALSFFPNYSAVSHWHDDIEFIYVLSGTMHYNVDGEIIILSEGEGILINSKHIHYGFSPQKSECDYICILLNPLLLCTSSAMEREFVTPLTSSQTFNYIHLTEAVDWQHNVMLAYRKIYDAKSDISAPLKIQAQFGIVWAILIEKFSNTKEPVPPNHNLTILKEMLGYIQQNYRSKISLADIAAAGAVGQSKCCKLFKSYLNQTPNSYLTQFRITKAIHLLKTTDRTIMQIALDTGFGGASYFAESFRKIIGCSPTEYKTRKQI